MLEIEYLPLSELKPYARNAKLHPAEQIEQIKKSIGVMYKNFPVGLYVVFSLYTGLRRGEVLALTYGDIDRKEKIVKVSKSVYFVSNEGRLKEPKTEAGIREVPIPDSLLKMLPNGKKSDYVFSTFSDRPMTESFQRDAMDHWQKETGLKLTAHQLRHGYATLLHEADIDVKDAQELLGHADAGTTQNIYTEVSAKRKKAVAERINSYLQ
jgi:integrase